MGKVILVIGAPSLEMIRTRYRRFYLFLALKGLRDTKVYWVTSSSKKSESGIKDEEIIFHHNKITGGFSPLPSKISQQLARSSFRNSDITLIYTLHRYPFILNLFKNSRVFYDCSDNWSHMPFSIKGAVQKFAQKSIFNRAEKITFSSQFLLQKYSDCKGDCLLVRSPGERLGEFSKGGPIDRGVIVGDLDVKKYCPKIIMEALNEFSLDLFGENKIPLKELLKYGPSENLKRLSIKGRVEKVDLRKKLTHYLFSVLPYNTSAFAKGVFPLKTFELLDSGLLLFFSGEVELEANSSMGIYPIQMLSASKLVYYRNQIDRKQVSRYLNENSIENYERKIRKFYEI